MDSSLANNQDEQNGAAARPENEQNAFVAAAVRSEPFFSLYSANLMQLNGRRILGPPEDWVGPPPSNACELFVRRIPKQYDMDRLIQPFLRLGYVYEMRVPMDFNNLNRGYAYVKYSTEEEATCAMEVLNHHYILPYNKLEVLHSYEKSRLFVNNIPKSLPDSEIEREMRRIFPGLERIYTRTMHENRPSGSDYMDGAQSGSGDGSALHIGNRGHAFLHFPSHAHALAAKKSVSPGIINLWGRDIKVVWANTDRDIEYCKETKTLFVRNVDYAVNNRDLIEMIVEYVPRTAIRKISKVRTTAFLDFTTREAAETVLRHLQGVQLRDKNLDIEWAKPSEQQSLHRMRNTDFDAVLRIKCIANGWQVPIVIFGTFFEYEDLQYAAVMLRAGNGLTRAVFCILSPHELADIHSRLCEVVCVLIENIGAFPDYNYLFLVQKDIAHLLGIMTHNTHAVEFVSSFGVPDEFFCDLSELIDLSWAVATLASVDERTLLATYQETFRVNSITTYMPHYVISGHRVFGTIMPKYRNKLPLKHNLNDTQVVLALCFLATGSNSSNNTRPYIPFPVTTFDRCFEGLRYMTLNLLPLALSQSRIATNHLLSHIEYGSGLYYHPAQHVNRPPLWLIGISYLDSIKNYRIEQIPTDDEQVDVERRIVIVQPRRRSDQWHLQLPQQQQQQQLQQWRPQLFEQQATYELQVQPEQWSNHLFTSQQPIMVNVPLMPLPFMAIDPSSANDPPQSANEPYFPPTESDDTPSTSGVQQLTNSLAEMAIEGTPSTGAIPKIRNEPLRPLPIDSPGPSAGTDAPHNNFFALPIPLTNNAAVRGKRSRRRIIYPPPLGITISPIPESPPPDLSSENAAEHENEK